MSSSIPMKTNKISLLQECQIRKLCRYVYFMSYFPLISHCKHSASSSKKMLVLLEFSYSIRISEPAERVSFSSHFFLLLSKTVTRGFAFLPDIILKLEIIKKKKSDT